MRQHTTTARFSFSRCETAPVSRNMRSDDRIYARGPHITRCGDGIPKVPLDDGMVLRHRRHVRACRHDDAACAGGGQRARRHVHEVRMALRAAAPLVGAYNAKSASSPFSG